MATSRPDHPFGGSARRALFDTIRPMWLVEISVVLLSAMAFWAFDLYTRACDAI